jgi:hypothetical protein
VLHYAQETFEGMKAYRHDDGSVWSFRPEENAKRMVRSSQRLALPELPVEDFVACVDALVEADRRWVPEGGGEKSLYVRPFMFASEAFLSGPPGQANYAAAKAGIAALTVSTARALASSGVRANAICPRARTAMTAQVFGEDTSGEEVDPYSPEHVAPVVAYLASPAAARITGQVFVVYGGMVALVAAPVVEERFDKSGTVWTAEDLDKQLGGHFADRDPSVGFAADSIMKLSV